MSESTSNSVASPRNPSIGFAFAAAWIAVAVFGIIVLLLDGERVLTAQVSGQRSVGFLMITPAIGAVIGVISAVRAFAALRPWNAYVARTTPEQRRSLTDSKFSARSFTPMVVVGAAVAVGWLVVLVVALVGLRSASTAGLSAIVMVLTLLGMAGATLISVGLRGNSAGRRRRSR